MTEQWGPADEDAAWNLLVNQDAAISQHERLLEKQRVERDRLRQERDQVEMRRAASEFRQHTLAANAALLEQMARLTGILAKLIEKAQK